MLTKEQTINKIFNYFSPAIRFIVEDGYEPKNQPNGNSRIYKDNVGNDIIDRNTIKMNPNFSIAYLIHETLHLLLARPDFDPSKNGDVFNMLSHATNYKEQQENYYDKGGMPGSHIPFNNPYKSIHPIAEECAIVCIAYHIMVDILNVYEEVKEYDSYVTTATKNYNPMTGKDGEQIISKELKVSSVMYTNNILLGNNEEAYNRDLPFYKAYFEFQGIMKNNKIVSTYTDYITNKDKRIAA